MYKEFSHIQRLDIATNRRNKIISIKYNNFKKNILKNGSNLFKKYNYYIFALVFVTLYITINMYTYFNGLNNDRNDYYNFLKQVYFGGIVISFILGILYGYAFLSYMFYPVSYKKNKKEIADPIIINFTYFFILSIEVYFKKIDDVLGFIMMISLIPIIAFLYLKYKKITLHVKSYNSIILKTLFFSIFAFFVINSQHVIFSFQLINNDLKNKFENTINEVVGQKKQEVISKIVKKINDKNIKNKQVFVYMKDNETHLVIKDKTTR